jgi:hypothetical protein
MNKIDFSNPSIALLSGIFIIIFAIGFVLVGVGYSIASLIIPLVV